MKLERVLKARVRRDLKTLTWAWFFKSSETAIRGIPDFIICLRGFFVTLELKRSSSHRASPLQAFVLSEIEKTAGGIAVVVHPDNWDDVFALLKRIDAGEKPSVLLRQTSLYEKPA